MALPPARGAAATVAPLSRLQPAVRLVRHPPAIGAASLPGGKGSLTPLARRGAREFDASSAHTKPVPSADAEGGREAAEAPASEAAVSGYLHPAYAASLRDLGVPQVLPL